MLRLLYRCTTVGGNKIYYVVSTSAKKSLFLDFVFTFSVVSFFVVYIVKMKHKYLMTFENNNV
jgi:hypothetical protein